MNLAELGKQAVGMWEGAGLLWWGKLKLAKDGARGMGMWMLLLLQVKLPVVERQPSHLEENWCDVRGLVTAFHALAL